MLGTMEVQYAPKLYMRSSYYGADEFFEITGDEGQIWVTRATGEMLDLAPVMLFTGNEHERKTTEFRDVDADWGAGFVRSSQHFVDSLVNGTPADMSAGPPPRCSNCALPSTWPPRSAPRSTPAPSRDRSHPTGWADW